MIKMGYAMVPYTCPRCLYSSNKKDSIQKHFSRARPCPALRADIALTEDIKDHVLANRVYCISKAVVDTCSSNQPHTVIYNYNKNYLNVMNFLDNKLSTVEKLTKLMQYLHLELQPIEDTIDNHFSHTVMKMESNSSKCHLELKMDDLLTAIDTISKTNHMSNNMNIIYDSDMNKLNVYDGEWNESIVSKGLKLVIEKLQCNYLDYYEGYIIKKYASSRSFQEKQKNLERLEEYYRFIAAFTLTPYCKDRTNDDLIDDLDKSFSLSDQLYEIYLNAKKDMKISERKQIHSKVLDIIKRNSAKSVKTLNSNVYDLFCKDNAFIEFLEIKIDSSQKHEKDTITDGFS